MTSGGGRASAEAGTTAARRDKLARAAGGRSIMRLLARVFPFVKKHRGALWLAIALLPVMSALRGGAADLLQRPSTNTSRPAGWPVSIAWRCFYLGALLGQYMAAFGHNYLVQVVGQRAMNDLRLACIAT